MRDHVRPFRRAAVSAVTLALAAATLVAVAPGASSAPQVSPRGSVDGTWTQVGAGFTVDADDTLSQVFQLTSREQFPDLRGTPGPIYAAGTFVASGGTTINRVAQNAGSGWTTLPGDDTGIAPNATLSVQDKIPSPGVYGLALGGNNWLYAGGQFVASDDTLNNVARWNGSNWVRMGDGLRITNSAGGYVVQDMVVGNDFIGNDDTNYADDTVYALGGFTHTCATLACAADGRLATGVAQYSQVDDTWYPVGNGAMSATSQAFAGAYVDDTLYVGGNFSSIGSVSALHIARWNDAAGTWAPLGGGLGIPGNAVYAMAVHPTTKDLYVGGTFGQAFGYPAASAPGIIKWDYTDDTWYSVGTGLTSGNVDDIGFSLDGNTMWLGLDAGAVDGNSAGYVAQLTSSQLSSPSATTVSGSWNAITSGGDTGVGGPAPSGGVNQTSVRAVYAIGNDSAMFGGNFHTAGATTAGRVARWSPPLPPPPPPPSIPPGAPTAVTATAGVQSVTVTWAAPSYSGTQPITNYRATASPGGATCEVNALTCTFTDLAVGTPYTFQVQAFNAVGWSTFSAPSNSASPLAPPPPPVPVSVSISSAERTISGRGTTISAFITTTGVDAGTPVVPWTRIGRGEWTPNSASTLVVGPDGSAQWKRKFGANRNRSTISIRFEVGGVFSDVTSLRPVK